jgi:hypothetical protein
MLLQLIMLFLQLVSNQLLPVMYLYFMSNIAEKGKIFERSKYY